MLYLGLVNIRKIFIFHQFHIHLSHKVSKVLWLFYHETYIGKIFVDSNYLLRVFTWIYIFIENVSPYTYHKKNSFFHYGCIVNLTPGEVFWICVLMLWIHKDYCVVFLPHLLIGHWKIFRLITRVFICTIIGFTWNCTHTGLNPLS